MNRMGFLLLTLSVLVLTSPVGWADENGMESAVMGAAKKVAEAAKPAATEAAKEMLGVKDDAKADAKPTDAEMVDALGRLEGLLAKEIDKAQSRSKMLNLYLKQKGLSQEFEAAKLTITHKPTVSLDQAIQLAVKQVKSDPGPPATDREVDATRMLVQEKWNQLTKLKTANRRMGDFLNSKGKFDDYRSWSVVESNKLREQAAAKAKADYAAMVKKHGEEEAKQEAERQMHIQWAHQDHEDRLKRDFQLTENAQYYNYKENVAPYEQGWNSWGDNYWDSPYEHAYNHAWREAYRNQVPAHGGVGRPPIDTPAMGGSARPHIRGGINR